MLRRALVAGLMVAGIAACGGPTPSATPASEVPTSSAGSAPVASAAPTASAPAPSPPAVARGKMTSICGAVGLRDSPSPSGKLVARLAVGTTVRVAATVTGDAYTVASCGVAGDQWLKIDKVGGKSVKALYGVRFVYSAAGMYR